ncbi:MAG: BlaI/MecI/CopY family transcriptional regulator [Bacteroidota bacterium]
MPTLKPTDAELAILHVLWTQGPSTVRTVHEALDRAQPVGYTTVLKLMQIMAEKGLATRDESQRAHVYAAAVPRERVQERLVGDLLDRAFGGSAKQLVLRALSSTPSSAAELAEIRALLDKLEEDQS